MLFRSARIRDAGKYMSEHTADNAGITGYGNTAQYEPYYLESQYKVTRDTSETQLLGNQQVAKKTDNTRERAEKGFQVSTYNGEKGF